MKDTVLECLRKCWIVSERDTGAYRELEKNGMTYIISAYELKGFGSMSTIEMTAMSGMMRMESFILTAETKDLPLFNGDLIIAMGKCTLLEEFYDTMLSPLPEEDLRAYRAVKAKYAGLPPYVTGPHWYDSIRYDFTLGAADASLAERADEITLDYLSAYLSHAEHAPAVDPAEKKARTRAYVDGLFANGGPAVDQFRQLFGEDAARDIFENCVFSCR